MLKETDVHNFGSATLKARSPKSQEATGSLHFVRIPLSSQYFSGCFFLCYNILVNIQFLFRSPKSTVDPFFLPDN